MHHKAPFLFLQCFPALEKLVISPCFDIPIMSDIRRYCPSIQQLQLGILTHVREFSSSPEGPTAGERAGLKHLCIENNFEYYYDARLVSNLLKTHGKTLETLDLNRCLGDNVNKNTQYPRLRRLVLSSEHPFEPCFGWWIPNHAPLLEELVVSSTAINDMLDTRSPNLKRLVMKMSRSTDMTRISDLTRFAERHAHLQALEIHSYIFYDILNLDYFIRRFDRLSTLVLGVDNDFEQHYMDEVVDKLVQGPTHLRQLTMNFKHGISKHAVETLANLKHLERLTIPINRSSAAGLIALAQCQQLKYLKVVHDFQHSDDFILELKQRRPDIDIEICATQRLVCYLN